MPSVEAAGEIIGAVGSLVGLGAKRLAQIERAEQKKLQKAKDAKKAIVDDVDANRRAGEFETASRALTKAFQTEFWDNPEDAAVQFRTNAGKFQDSALFAAPNDAVRAKLAKATAAQINLGARELDRWADARLTQKAQNELESEARRIEADAESLTSPEALTVYLKANEAQLRPLMVAVRGPEADKRIAEMRTEATRSFVLASADRNPLATLNMLDADTGPIAENLSVSQRKSLRSSTKSSFEGYGKIREVQILKAGISQNQGLFAAALTGELDSGTVAARKRALGKQRLAIKNDPTFDDSQKARQLNFIAEQEKYVDAIDTWRRRQLSFDASSNMETVGDLIRKSDELFTQDNGQKGEDLAAWSKLYTEVAVAARDKKLSGHHFTTLLKTLSLALPEALDAEESNTGFNFGLFTWRSPRQAGNHELNKRFDGEFKNLSPQKQAAVRISFMEQLNIATESGTQVNEGLARKMALQAISTETGLRVPGVD